MLCLTRLHVLVGGLLGIQFVIPLSNLSADTRELLQDVEKASLQAKGLTPKIAKAGNFF